MGFPCDMEANGDHENDGMKVFNSDTKYAYLDIFIFMALVGHGASDKCNEFEIVFKRGCILIPQLSLKRIYYWLNNTINVPIEKY